MFAGLPKPLQEEIICYMQADNFRAAKKLYDDYYQESSSSVEVKNEIEESAA